MSLKKDQGEILAKAKSFGWDIQTRHSGHLVLRRGDDVTFTASTPGDYRGLKNFEARLRRMTPEWSNGMPRASAQLQNEKLQLKLDLLQLHDKHQWLPDKEVIETLGIKLHTWKKWSLHRDQVPHVPAARIREAIELTYRLIDELGPSTLVPEPPTPKKTTPPKVTKSVFKFEQLTTVEVEFDPSVLSVQQLVHILQLCSEELGKRN